jgi:hypothetical protein
MPTRSAPACNVVDTNTKLTGGRADPAILQKIANAGYAGVIRYVPLPENDPAGDIDAVELNAIIGANLGLLLIQHVYGDRQGDPWDPATKDGTASGQAAVASARQAGYAAGAHIYLDLENIDGTTKATTVYANAWAAAVTAGGFLAGLYVGFDVPLTPDELYDLPDFNTYWSADGDIQAVSRRGYAVKQGAGIEIGNVTFDPDIVAPDHEDETPVWMHK